MIESNCTNLVPDKPQKTQTSLWLFLINFTYQQIFTFISFPVSFKTSFISGRFTVVNERHVLSVFFYAGISKFPFFQNAMNQSSQGTKVPKAHDAVPVFCEHPLRILKRQNYQVLVQREAARLVHGQAIERK